MSNGSVEVQLAVAIQRLDQVIAEQSEAKEGRKEQYKSMEAMRASVDKMGGRLENVEKQVASAQPTIEEFITIKHKVVGAGAMGRWLWIAGGILLGWAANSREAVFAWLNR